jgi:hypothetical protein
MSEIFTTQMTRKYILPVVHIGISGDKLNLNISGIESMNEFLFNAKYILGKFNFKNVSSKQIEKLSVEGILTTGRSHDKKY